MAKEYRLSAERLEELKQELTYLKTVREKEVAELIKEARSFGDLSENSEYDEAKNWMRFCPTTPSLRSRRTTWTWSTWATTWW